VQYSKHEIIDIVSKIDKEKLIKPDISVSSILLDQPITELEVTKPYPKRVTAAEIVQMNPSPKAADSKNLPTEEKEKEKEKEKKTEKPKHSKPQRASHNGNSKESKVVASKPGSSSDSKPSQT